MKEKIIKGTLRALPLLSTVAEQEKLLSEMVDSILEKNKELKSFKCKAEKWDSLDKQLGKIYDEEDDSAEGDLCDIGELCANRFGYL